MINKSILGIGSMRVVTCDHLFESYIAVPVRKHKKSRVQKKWNKRYGYNVVTKIDTNSFIVGDVLYCHSSVLDKIEQSTIVNRFSKEVNK